MAKVKNEKTDGIITVSQGVPMGSREDETDWDRLHAMTEEEIERNAREDPETLCLEDCDLTQLRVVTPPEKKQISVRMDGDVVDWFQSLGKGYQTRMNAVLRAYMESRKREGAMEK